jgi:DNA-binding response OmpR family regulator
MAEQTHVLFVEDDDVIREATQLALERDGFVVTAAPDGLTGLERFRADRPDIALLDVMVPGLDGVSLCRRIRNESTVPVILLSARPDSIDVVLGLEAGADDYVTKPFDGAVLVARIRAVLRRRGAEALDRLSYDDLVCDLGTHEVTRAGRRIELTITEFDVLTCLVRNPRRIQSRETLLRIVWGYDVPVDSNVVDVHIGHLRRKLGDPPLIQTMRGIGYVLRSQQ